MLLVVKSFSTCQARLARQELRRPDAIPWDAEEDSPFETLSKLTLYSPTPRARALLRETLVISTVDPQICAPQRHISFKPQVGPPGNPILTTPGGHAARESQEAPALQAR
ncbi:predicted protein [Histoplasma capsulatum H143]|uniref:Uncharacterized protein n=1 Tax=Ajellomyces capsulatus (strain H143) TaxID=544712 RepID=C6HFC8_AJECH|nr:predicted protein [Histoplasma capsulatum H143]